MESQKLPSGHQIGDPIWFQIEQWKSGKVVAVKFTTGKVLYDLDLLMYLPNGDRIVTRIHGVDSAFVGARDERQGEPVM